ncbi:MAG: hypothetical protein AAFQ14_02865 [Cyanobacteria bacterium J06621_12]
MRKIIFSIGTLGLLTFASSVDATTIKLPSHFDCLGIPTPTKPYPCDIPSIPPCVISGEKCPLPLPYPFDTEEFNKRSNLLVSKVENQPRENIETKPGSKEPKSTDHRMNEAIYNNRSTSYDRDRVEQKVRENPNCGRCHDLK